MRHSHEFALSKTATSAEAPLSDEERMNAYAETGDPSYLTIELARKMQVGPDVMRQVEGVTAEEKEMDIADFTHLSNDELENYIKIFLGNEVINLGQAEINRILLLVLTEVSRRDLDSSHLFLFVLPEHVTAEEIKSGDSSWAKVYKALFEISATDTYKVNPKVQVAVCDLQNSIDQNPQMVGPVAMWNIAKNVMWRRDIPSHVKGSLIGSMTYALAFFDTERYETELLRNLDLNDPSKYTEVAHMLEAMKQFWSGGHDSYAEGTVPDFYIRVLRKLESSPSATYLLVVRAREILSVLEDSEYFPDEAVDTKPFEIARGVFASTQFSDGIYLVPEDANEALNVAISEYETNEEKITPPQWMIDEALARGDQWLTWAPPHDLLEERDRLFDAMHNFAIIPLEEKLHKIGGVTNDNGTEKIFDYEYPVSKPIRQLIQREFGINLVDLSIPEQFYFLNYLKHTTVSDVETMKAFIATYGITGMRTFLALAEGGKDLGDKIVHFGQYPELAIKVFRHYTELLDAATNAESLVRAHWQERTDVETLTQTIEAVSTDILSKAQKDLERAVLAGDPEALANKIDTFVAGARIYVTLLNEVTRVPLESVSARSLGENFKSAARRMSEQNYANETSEFQAIIKESLDNAFLSDTTRFYTETDADGRVIFFDRFDDGITSDGRVIKYFGSVNSDPAYAGIGKLRIGETLEKELDSCDLMYAHCDPRNPISQFYVEHGFIATQTVSPAGKFSFEIWRSKDSSEQLKTKQMTEAELVALAGETLPAEADYFVREVEPNDQFLELDSGLAFLLTRYFTVGGKTYAAFELNVALSQQFVPPVEK